jgi:hypothetical protein
MKAEEKKAEIDQAVKRELVFMFLGTAENKISLI